MPQTHSHHGHGHSHSRSRSPARFGTLNRSFKMDTSSATALLDQEKDQAHYTHDHDHQHSHSHSSQPELHDHDNGHNHNHNHGHSNGSHGDLRSGGSKMQARQHIPAPLMTGNVFSTSSTAAGKLLVTPKNPSISEPYKAPEAKLPKHVHDHSAERSRFTNSLLPYTARWPLLHAVMTEKDSRRIFYFMR